jgi:hypothetical protein
MEFDSLLFGLPDQLNNITVVNLGQKVLDGQNCTLVKGNAEYSQNDTRGSLYNISFVMCLSNVNNVPLNISYSSAFSAANNPQFNESLPATTYTRQLIGRITAPSEQELYSTLTQFNNRSISALNLTLTAAPGTSITTGESVNLTASWYFHAGDDFYPYTLSWYSGSSTSCQNDTTPYLLFKVPINYDQAIKWTQSFAPTKSTYYCFEIQDSKGSYEYSPTLLITVSS